MVPGKKGLGCCSFVALLGIGLGAYFLIKAGPGPHKPPGTAANAKVAATGPARKTPGVGDPCLLALPGGHGVWLAATDDSYNEMLDAQNAGSVALLERLADQGKVLYVGNGTRGVVVRTAVLSALVRVQEGPFRGEEGWVQKSFVHPAD